MIVLSCAASFAEERAAPHVPTGIEWLQASGKAREEGLLAALMSVQAAGIQMREDFLYYDDSVRRQLLRHPELQARPLTDALAGFLYENDPAARPVLDSLRSSGKKPD